MNPPDKNCFFPHLVLVCFGSFSLIHGENFACFGPVTPSSLFLEVVQSFSELVGYEDQLLSIFDRIDHQLAHLICVCLKHLLYDFFRRCFGPFI